MCTMKKTVMLLLVFSFFFLFSCAPAQVSGPQSQNDVAQQENQDEAQAAQEEDVTKTEGYNDFVNKDIYFDFDQSTLTDDAIEALKEKAKWLIDNPLVTVVIEGHCDERGTSEYNLALGDKRANSAKKFFINMGIAPDRIETLSYGEEKPASFGHDEESWTKNRRAHFLVK